jgi:hypothetical protein
MGGEEKGKAISSAQVTETGEKGLLINDRFNKNYIRGEQQNEEKITHAICRALMVKGHFKAF